MASSLRIKWWNSKSQNDLLSDLLWILPQSLVLSASALIILRMSGWLSPYIQFAIMRLSWIYDLTFYMALPWPRRPPLPLLLSAKQLQQPSSLCLRYSSDMPYKLAFGKLIFSELINNSSFTIAKIWKQAKCPSTGEWVKMWCVCVCIMKCSPAVKSKFFHLQEQGWTVKYFAKWNKSNRERQIQYDIT